jgi:hypothetical protein
LYAGSPLGSIKSIIMAHSFEIATPRALVGNGLTTAEQRSVRSGQRRIEVTWMEVTDAGRRAFAG